MHRILLAEDEVSLSRASAHLLEKNGYEVETAYDGEETMEKISRNHYDLVLLDVMMPKKDGLQVLSELRQNGNDIKVIMLTAKSEVDDKVLGFENGADDYITKPYALKELLARIKNVLKNSATEYEYKDIILNCTDNTIRGKNDSNYVFDLSKAETELLRKTMQGTSVSLHVAASMMDSTEQHVELYVDFINKKLSRISENVKMQIVDRKVVII